MAVDSCSLASASNPHSSMRPSRQVTRALRTFSTSTTTSAASTSTSYTAPLKAGVLPAYDQALAYIAQDRKDKLSQLEKLGKQKDVDQSLLEKLEVEAWANDPETRWRAASGSGQSSGPFFLWEGRGDRRGSQAR